MREMRPAHDRIDTVLIWHIADVGAAHALCGTRLPNAVDAPYEASGRDTCCEDCFTAYASATNATTTTPVA